MSDRVMLELCCLQTSGTCESCPQWARLLPYVKPKRIKLWNGPIGMFEKAIDAEGSGA